MSFQDKYSKYKGKYLLMVRGLNKYDFGSYLRYVISDNRNPNETDEERNIKRAVEHSSYMLPLRPRIDKSTVYTEKQKQIILLLQKAAINTNFKNKIDNTVTEPETYTVIEYNNIEDANNLVILLKSYDINIKVVNDARNNVPFYYMILKPLDMLLLIKLLINTPVPLKQIKTMTGLSGDYFRSEPVSQQKLQSSIPFREVPVSQPVIQPDQQKLTSSIPFRAVPSNKEINQIVNVATNRSNIPYR